MFILHFMKGDIEEEYLVLTEAESSAEHRQHARPGFKLHGTHEIEFLDGTGHGLPLDEEFLKR